MTSSASIQTDVFDMHTATARCHIQFQFLSDHCHQILQFHLQCWEIAATMYRNNVVHDIVQFTALLKWQNGQTPRRCIIAFRWWCWWCRQRWARFNARTFQTHVVQAHLNQYCNGIFIFIGIENSIHREIYIWEIRSIRPYWINQIVPTISEFYTSLRIDQNKRNVVSISNFTHRCVMVWTFADII